MVGMYVLAAKGFDLGRWWDDHGIATVALVVLAGVITVVTRILVSRFGRRLEKGDINSTQELNLQRAATLTRALSTTAIVVIWVIALLFVVGTFASIGPLVASASVLGVALGFGAQSLVKDTLSGFFILFENQFGVNDVIELQTSVGTVGGKVEALTLRVTSLRAFDGTIHIVPNGNIQYVSNKSRGWARAIVDVRVAYSEDVNRVRSTLEQLFVQIRKDPVLRDWIREGPSVLGIETLADYGQVIRVVAETRPSRRWDTERQLRERIARHLSENGITVPLPPTPTSAQTPR
jgi:small-conductance mechanosensitive channel